ncbi:uncharacterized protein LOC144652487 isoform X2 [Oculina patagonica]
MSAPENGGSSSMDDDGDPPPLSIKLTRLGGLPKTSRPSSDVQLPVDVLLLTVKNSEFLACHYYLRNAFRSYFQSFGYAYFGNMSDQQKPWKVALVRCSKGSSDPGGSQTVAKNAVTQLRPKVTFCVGSCKGLSREKAKLGDVVISSKLTTDAYKTPVSKDIGNLVRNAADGWEAPLENPEARDVQVHCDGEILSCPDPVSVEQQCKLHPGAIAAEREGKGIFAAAHDMKSEWVVVKGVSHFADSSTCQSWESFACVMAASVVSNILCDPFVFEQWPHYGEESSSTISTKRDLPISSSKDAKRIKLMMSDLPDISAAEGSSMGDLPCSSDLPDAEQSSIAEPFNLKECQRQLRDIYNTTSKVKIIPWDSESAIHITEIYTQLSWVKDDRKARGVTKERLEDYTDIFKGDKHYPKPRRILVYGRPGIGKTVFTQKTTFDWSQQRKEVFRKFDIVLLIKLRDVCDLQDIHAILSASELLANDGMISVDNMYDYILKNQERVLLILDGYDEYSAGTSSPVVDIWESRLLRDCHVIMTTRELKAGKLRKRSHVQFGINGFDSEDQIKKFARKLLKDEKDVEEFVIYLKEKDLKGMAEIPLLLLMLCLLWKGKHHRGLPQSRAGIYTGFIQTLLDHLIEKDADAKQFRNVDDYKEELCKLGKLAFDALLQDCLSFHISELPDVILSTKLIEVGLFHVLNVASLTPEKAVVFIHKSLQEFLAAFYLKEELLNEQSTSCLSKVESFEKILNMVDVLKFACELSAEAACAVLHHLGTVGKNEGLTEYNFTETPCILDLSEQQRQFLTLISHSVFCCAAEKRRDLYSMFLSYVGGVLLIDSDQLHSVANEHLLKSAEVPEFIFFSNSFYNDKHPEQSYHGLITVLEDVNAVVVSCSSEKKASNFIKKYPFRPVSDFFLKKEGKKLNIYMTMIRKTNNSTFLTEMLKELISSPESTQKKKSVVADQSNEQDNRTALCLTDNNDSTTDQPRHCLSCVRDIYIDIESQEMETLVEVLPFVTSPRCIWIYGKAGAPELSETLVSCINFTNRLEILKLERINLTAKAAAVIARSLPQAPNLRMLDLSSNPLGKGVSDLTRHLSCVPHLEYLYLVHVKMTKKQVNDLTEAVRQSNIPFLGSSYHDLEGNLEPEHEWPTEDFWKERPWPEPGTATESEDELGPG